MIRRPFFIALAKAIEITRFVGGSQPMTQIIRGFSLFIALLRGKALSSRYISLL